MFCVELIVEIDGKGAQVGSVFEESPIATHSHAGAFRHHKYLQLPIVLNHFQQRIFLELQHLQTQTLQPTALGQSPHQLGVVQLFLFALGDCHFPQSLTIASEVVDPVGVIGGVVEF